MLFFIIKIKIIFDVENYFVEFMEQWGPLGVMVVLGGFLVYDNWKMNKAKKSNDGGMDIITGKIDNLSESIKIIDQKVDNVNSSLQSEIDLLHVKVDDLPTSNINASIVYEEEQKSNHIKQLDDLMKLGPKLHKIMGDFNEKIGSDHIFLGSFHNGNSSLSGIPYYKFDIIAERFGVEKISNDCEFAPLYKDADILRFDSLPVKLVQESSLYFAFDENGDTKMKKYDDILWRRMLSRGIKQIAFVILRDGSAIPSGFLGCVKYDNAKKLNMKKLKECGKKLETIYHISENNEE
jgi:hypothetical protein